MKRRTRIHYTPEQKAIIWDRYKQGDSLHDIARMFDRFHSSILNAWKQYRVAVKNVDVSLAPNIEWPTAPE